jgi:hypothetical protein
MQVSISKILIESDTGFYNVVISILFNCMWFVWDYAYFTVMNHEHANKLTLYILQLWVMNLLISKTRGLSPKASIINN